MSRRKGLPLGARWHNLRYGALAQLKLGIFRWRQKQRLMTHTGWIGMLMIALNLLMALVLFMNVQQRWPLWSFILAPVLVIISLIWANRAFYLRVKRFQQGKQRQWGPTVREWLELFDNSHFMRFGWYGAFWLFGYLLLWLYMQVSGNRSLWLLVYPGLFLVLCLIEVVRIWRNTRTADMPFFEVRSIEIEEDPDDE